MNDIEIQFDLIEEKGTRIVMWNLRMVENTHKYELDFDHDKHDIYLNADVSTKPWLPRKFTIANNSQLLPTAADKHPRETVDTQKNDHLASLRKYLTILYMVPKMKIVLRDVPVKYVQIVHVVSSNTRVEL